jgi:hypothetical protein
MTLGENETERINVVNKWLMRLLKLSLLNHLSKFAQNKKCEALDDLVNNA